MSNPMRTFEHLRDTYLRYLDSPFNFRYADLVSERRRLLDTDGRIYRHPLIEPVPAYRSSGQSLETAAQDILAGLWQPSEIADASEFISLGLFPSGRELYQHQRDVLQDVLVDRRDSVVTTGTGSGKTECFLLPIVATLIRESASWPAPSQRPHGWDWWNDFTVAGRQRRWAQRVPQRAHEVRPAAMRALILYPLNALVEDQLSRLREGLDSEAARQWLGNRRSGNLIYFGRYTGRTPISGGRSAENTARLRAELQSMEADASAVHGTEAQRFFPGMRGGEMWSRWDMQDAPPDILITNYCMLNIMLMRTLEAPVFGHTRQWLRQSQENVFHLVVDELHTYRGTPGTEVAYLLRVLLDRLGLSPASDQLRVISSSASLESGDTGKRYLEQFFSRSRERFHAIGGQEYVVRPAADAPMRLSAHRGALAVFGRSVLKDGPGTLAEQSMALAAATGAPTLADEGDAPAVLAAVANHIGAVDALRLACAVEGRVVPRSPDELVPLLFPDAADGEAVDAVDGLLTALSHARDARGMAPLPMRVHIMLRNLQGLWVCTSPSCTEVHERSGFVPVGALHYLPKLTCGCGARILELLYCEACGEVFFGGYRRGTGNPGEWYLSPDHPNLEAAPDLQALDRHHSSYAVFWPAPDELSPGTPTWTQDHVGRAWTLGSLDTVDGTVCLGRRNDSIRGYLYHVAAAHSLSPPPDRLGREPYPSICPRCDADWRRRDLIRSPIRTQRTGFQKVAQVLADSLLRDLTRPPMSSSRKLVVFSDSRQDAAKLSAGMRFSHYRDALRQALVQAMRSQSAGPHAFSMQLTGETLHGPDVLAATRFQGARPLEATTLAMAANAATAGLPSILQSQLTNEQMAAQILSRASAGPFRVTQLADDVAGLMLAKGMNPAGCTQSVTWTEPETRTGSWRDLYNWPADGTGDAVFAKSAAELTQQQQTHLARVQRASVAELMDIVFASGRRGMESLLLALPTVDLLAFPAPSVAVREGAEGTIFLFGSRRRLSSHPCLQRDSAPRYVSSYLETVAGAHDLDATAYTRDVLAYLDAARCLNTAHFHLNVAALCMLPPTGHGFQCLRCRRVQMNPSGGSARIAGPRWKNESRLGRNWLPKTTTPIWRCTPMTSSASTVRR